MPNEISVAGPDETIPAWAFRFLQSIPGVAVTLSGMSNMQQLEENLSTFEAEHPLNQQEMETTSRLPWAEKPRCRIRPLRFCSVR